MAASLYTVAICFCATLVSDLLPLLLALDYADAFRRLGRRLQRRGITVRKGDANEEKSRKEAVRDVIRGHLRVQRILTVFNSNFAPFILLFLLQASSSFTDKIPDFTTAPDTRWSSQCFVMTVGLFVNLLRYRPDSEYHHLDILLFASNGIQVATTYLS